MAKTVVSGTLSNGDAYIVPAGKLAKFFVNGASIGGGHTTGALYAVGTGDAKIANFSGSNDCLGDNPFLATGILLDAGQSVTSSGLNVSYVVILEDV